MLGMGLDGFLSSVLTLLQGVEGPTECIKNISPDYPEFIEYYSPPLFDTKLYFVFISVVFVLSTIEFVLLNKQSACEAEYCM